ncbi:hypothetical protein KIN20_004261 [Parelaphostrongylus tenuis]|uniref:Uncharacterized protein n=1 Tax=Parelaphostrongylus tenuis TaxID=148309 RepID=A0AAD5QJ61_PARTN|nr:hypothetical protein KIN20_004261 [Parelaphostrongylus tenuis]
MLECNERDRRARSQIRQPPSGIVILGRRMHSGYLDPKKEEQRKENEHATPYHLLFYALAAEE